MQQEARSIARGERFLHAAEEALTGYSRLVGQAHDWRLGVAAAFVRFLVWIRPDADIPEECQEKFAKVIGYISILASSVPGLQVEETLAIERLAMAISEEDAQRLANDIVDLRASVLKANSSWRN